MRSRSGRARLATATATAGAWAVAFATCGAAFASCPRPEGSTVLRETPYLRVLEVPGPGDPLANLTGCLHAEGTQLTLASRYANKHGRGTYAMVGVGYTVVGFRIRVTDRAGRVDSNYDVVDLRNQGPPRGGGSRAGKVIDLAGDRLAWTSINHTSTGKAKRFVHAAGPRGLRRLAVGRDIALHRLTSQGRRVYWRQDGKRRSALVA